jgi:lipopolysaccharide transport system permease protein
MKYNSTNLSVISKPAMTTSDIPSKQYENHLRIERSKGWLSINFVEIWRYRDLLQIMAGRDIRLRYKQTALGVTWVILQPLLTSALFAIIFGRLANLPSGDVAYELFAFAGMLPWNIFSQSMQRSSQSLVKDAGLITKVYFPRIILPIASSVSTILDFGVSGVIFFLLLLLYKIPLTYNLFAIPVLLFLCLITSIGVGLWISAFSVFYRDFIYALPFIIQLWMYASPLAYSIDLIPEEWLWLYSLNPLTGILESFRWALLGGEEFPWLSAGLAIIISVVIFFTGSFVFKRMERSFADVI